MARLVFLLILLSILAIIPLSVAAQTPSNSFNMRVYSDGSAAVVQSLTVNSSAVSITVPLLSPVITNVFATDQNGSPLSFQISGQNITVYTVGATEAIIQYDTDSLTSKQGSVWTLAFTTSFNLTVTLPQHSSLSSVSNTPVSLSVQNGSPVVVASPGNWTIKYGVPLEAASTTRNTSASSSSSVISQKSSSKAAAALSSQSLELGLAALSAAVLGLGGYAFFTRRNTALNEASSTDLRPDDIQVLDFISEKGGKVFEQEIRARFTLPKTSTWRQIKRLERLGYVRVSKIGSQNQIELLKRII